MKQHDSLSPLRVKVCHHSVFVYHNVNSLYDFSDPCNMYIKDGKKKKGTGIQLLMVIVGLFMLISEMI
jgi:hypothetical protein